MTKRKEHRLRALKKATFNNPNISEEEYARNVNEMSKILSDEINRQMKFNPFIKVCEVCTIIGLILIIKTDLSPLFYEMKNDFT